MITISPFPTSRKPLLIEFIDRAAAVERKEWAAVQHGRRRQGPLFAFARELRQCPALSEFDGMAALAEIRDALKKAGTSLDIMFPDADDAAIAFLAGWRNADLVGLFSRAARTADEEPQPIIHAISARYSRFCNICKHLQRMKGAEPFILCGRIWAAELGISERTITTYKRQAEIDGLIQLAEPHDRLLRRASRYKYIGPTAKRRS